MNKKPILKKSLTFSISDISNIPNNKNLLSILDELEEEEDNSYISYIKNIKNKCKCCNLIILNHKIEDHQISCFQKKIETLKIQMSLIKENVAHELHIKGIELLIQRNNEKWNKLMKDRKKI